MCTVVFTFGLFSFVMSGVHHSTFIICHITSTNARCLCTVCVWSFIRLYSTNQFHFIVEYIQNLNALCTTCCHSRVFVTLACIREKQQHNNKNVLLCLCYVLKLQANSAVTLMTRGSTVASRPSSSRCLRQLVHVL